MPHANIQTALKFTDLKNAPGREYRNENIHRREATDPISLMGIYINVGVVPSSQSDPTLPNKGDVKGRPNP